ncbi:hypothetical protein QQ045_008010 [Rhodiola kirilowii]
MRNSTDSILRPTSLLPVSSARPTSVPPAQPNQRRFETRKSIAKKARSIDVTEELWLSSRTLWLIRDLSLCRLLVALKMRRFLLNLRRFPHLASCTTTSRFDADGGYTRSMIPPRPDLTQTVATLGYTNMLCCLKSHVNARQKKKKKVYGHKIYQYLENLLTPLSKITNEDRIVAYRLPKLSGLTRLEIIHQYHGKSGERKLLGSPLVTYLNDDCLSGAGIDRCVTRVLLPLKRSATKSQCNKENALLPAEINTEIDSLGSQSITQSTVDEKDDEMFDSELTFHLCLVDSGGKVSSPLKVDTLIRPGKSIKILLDWTDKELFTLRYSLKKEDYEKMGRRRLFSFGFI